ncbi:oxidoreductase [bacterium (Candidatus Blackallbacteria) CG17_big_fil_post_rev_8_21_14_2_50_48_46]|uniref:Oxidoreductase n=1 Tax=bacterium (Candidatus Blackallbacteria) CG17_big_fil_post_rev_8_21_14_2_50_48_46 TaxID=2014261 RepID=A0A2M7FXP9_9BACT|nr:MAG: oxidoreductase [bacterium (Candidatus Blackallbacteria) CG18_big_fil_WC_8_21_14_2_50_49_26]PIW14021.1 MAG: oxidoreductase [bacterium (Candidatus Blackallbacteria) CG17_big_fil_post_rev_8_21_14_2_50_48_46]PIW46873.1 MAG: oxidoreductase [bacterium (Candidatus Blackallbacteria) CG13_big_fil_rev_8_21_14_2_50_49_14]
MQTNSFLLTTLIFLPVLGALSLFFVRSQRSHIYHWLAAGWSGLTFLLSLFALSQYQHGLHNASGKAIFQLVDRLPWMPAMHIQYQVGVDGLSLPMVLLTTLIVFVAVFASWGIQERSRMYFMMLLIMETAVLGVFTSLDLFQFFVMWELELIPMYFLIGLWGGPRRGYAAIKFILYTMLASAFMFIAFLAIYFFSQPHTFDVIALLENHNSLLATLAPSFQILVLVSLLLCFCVKLPMVPFHTWLPDAHVEAPTAISVVLAGVLLKMGAYGIIRFGFGFFPDLMKQLAVFIAAFGMINILYGALLALAQTDMKRVIAYSSVSHMGFVLLGLAAMNPMGLDGAIMQMFTHGTITALLFIFVGVVYDRTHTRVIADLGGLSAKMPLASAFFVMAALASVGAPGMSGFVSEFLIFVGSYGNHLKGIPHFAIQLFTVGSALGIILGAGYTLWLTQRVFFGSLPQRWQELTDMNRVELFNVVILTLLVVALGFYPALLMDMINPAAEQLISLLPK